jgi:hypothetical protein
MTASASLQSRRQRPGTHIEMGAGLEGPRPRAWGVGVPASRTVPRTVRATPAPSRTVLRCTRPPERSRGQTCENPVETGFSKVAEEGLEPPTRGL